jgi:hypothetical protein
MMALVLPIQLASFLMTLCRKNIISTKTYHIVYSLSLLLGYSIQIQNLILYLSIIFGFLFMYLRIKCNYNKYILWIIPSIYNIIIYTNDKYFIYTSLISAIVYLIFYYNDLLFDKRIRTETNNIVISNNKIDSSHLHEIKIKLAINNFDNINNKYFNLFYNAEKYSYVPTHYNKELNELTFNINSNENDISSKICSSYKINSTICIKGPFDQ